MTQLFSYVLIKHNTMIAVGSDSTYKLRILAVKNLRECREQLLQHRFHAVDGILSLKLNPDGRGFVGLIEQLNVSINQCYRSSAEGCVCVDNIACDECWIEVGLRCL